LNRHLTGRGLIKYIGTQPNSNFAIAFPQLQYPIVLPNSLAKLINDQFEKGMAVRSIAVGYSNGELFHNEDSGSELKL